MPDNPLVGTNYDPDEDKSLLETMAGPLASEAWRIISIPHDVMTGKIPFDQQESAARELAFNMAGSGIGASQLIKAPEGALGIFAGRNAATANQDALQEAMQIEGQHNAMRFMKLRDAPTVSATRQQIYDKTGWFKGADNKWRFEIPDQSATYDSTAEELRGTNASQPHYGPTSTIEGAVEHPELFKAYPQLRELGHQLSSDVPKGVLGQYFPAQGIVMNKNFVQGGEATLESPTSVMLHELQHGVQDIEGFGYGTAPENFLTRSGRKLLRSAYPELNDFYQNVLLPAVRNVRSIADVRNVTALKQQYADTVKSLSEPAYQRSAGEVEARNVQNRMNMSDVERQAIPPWQTQDFPNEEQIVFDKNGKPLSLTPIDYDPFELKSPKPQLQGEK